MSVKGPASWREDGRPMYKFAKFILDGKPAKEREDKWDYGQLVDIYMGEETLSAFGGDGLVEKNRNGGYLA